jgi:elongator complex protein 1
MLNLKLLVELRARFSFNPEANLSLIAFDSTNGTLLTYSTDNVLSGYVVDGISGNLKALFHLQLATADVLPPDAVVVDMQFVPDLESIILVTKDGDIVSFNLNSREAECVGTIDSGIVAMAWSPDFELMLLATGNSTLLTMTNEWDVLSEVSLFPKRNIDSTFDVEVSDLPEGDLTPRLDIASLSWRGDGKFFVTNAKNPVTGWSFSPHFLLFFSSLSSFLLLISFPFHLSGEAVMHVFERLSVHSAVCDPSEMKGTEEQVSWRPSGNFIVSTKVTKSPSSNKHEVTFYERNGLRHYEFPLRGEEASFKVVSLSWNCDSDILSILLRSLDNNSDVMQLWTTSNYHWYLKQEFNYEPREKVVKISWDAEDGSLLRVATNKGNYFQYTFAWEYTVSQGNSPANPTFATMIDGEQILLTPFRHLVTPPPMSATSLTLPSSTNNHQRRIRTISYSPFDSESTGSHFRMLVHSSDGSLLLYSVPTSNHYFPLQNNPTKATPPNFSAPPTLLGIYTPSGSEENVLSSSSRILRQVELIDESTVAAVFSELEGASPATSRDQIVRFRFSLVDSTLKITEVLRTSAPKRVLRLVNNKDTFTTLLELVDGSLFRLTPSGSSLGLSPVTFGFEGATAAPGASTLPAPCQWIATTLMGGRETVIALDKRNKLYIDGRLASSECNSFTLHNEFLLFTTLTHNLRFVRLRVPFDGKESSLVFLHSFSIFKLSSYRKPFGNQGQHRKK